MGKLSFLLQFFFKPRTIGAVMPSSKYLAKKMIACIDFNNAKSIVEYGPGTGVFTEEILRNRGTDTLVILFEMNRAFYQELTKKYKNEPNLHIVNDSARNVKKHVRAHGLKNVDYIVSGLPFAILPQETAVNILKETKKYLSPTGAFIMFQYSLLKRDFIGRYFDSIEITRELRNIPPAYVLRCR
jgi:phospholipid N-methyltransferase